MEQAILRGKLNPASGIFLMKNWLNYKDSYSFEEVTETKADVNKPKETLEQIIAEFGDLLPDNADIES
mgnify:FL=1|nr:hypothetical protein [uncultured Blautia sp.]